MSKFLDDLFDNLEKPENETPEEVATEANEVEAIEPEVEETTETDEGDSEEVSETEAVEEASETTEAEDDDDGEELPPAERKAYGRLKALIDEREKRQAADEARKSAEAERDRLNLELAEMRRQQQEAASQALPDPYSDPQGYAAAREAQFEEQLTRQKLAFSIDRATEKMGVEEVEAAANWFQDQIAKNPHMPLRQTMISQADPMSYVLTSYQQAQKVQAIASGDYSQIVAELQKAGFNISKADTPTATAPAAPVTPQVAATPATPATTAPAAPKRSKLASSGGSTLAAPSEVSMIDAVFRR